MQQPTNRTPRRRLLRPDLRRTRPTDGSPGSTTGPQGSRRIRLPDCKHGRWEPRRHPQATESQGALISPRACSDGEIELIARYRIVSALQKEVTIVVCQ